MPGCTFKGTTYSAAALWQEDSKVEYGPNPKRPASKSFDRYAAYEQAATVGEALKLGSLPDDLMYDFEKGHLKVLEPLRKEPLDLFAVKSVEDLTYTDTVLAKWVHLATATGQEDGQKKLLTKQVDASLRQFKQRWEDIRNDHRRKVAKVETAKALGVKDVDSLHDSTGFFESATMMARRTHANEQAKEMLEVVEKEGRALTDYEVLQVLRLWDFRKNEARQNVMKEGETFVYSDTVGIVALYTGKVAVKEECRRYPEFGRLLNHWLRDNLPKDLGTDFVYTSININKNYAARVHRDGNNVGPSLIKAFGDFSGGELHYYPEDDKSIGVANLDPSESAQVDISNGLLLFDGKRAHFVNDFEGERYSLVFFTCPRFERITEENMEYMRAADFPYPTEDTMSNVTSLLRKPKGKKANKAQEETVSSIHNAPFLFWPHASSEHSEKEAHAEEYWKARGIRSRIEKMRGYGAFSFENVDETEWSEHSILLPSKPVRKDLILEQFTNKNDAIIFLNKEDSVVPESILQAGCCAVKSKRTSSWYALYIIGKKDQALACFGLVKEPCASSMTQEGSKEAQQPVTTPSKKRNMLVVSAKNTKRKRTEASVADAQVGDVVGPPCRPKKATEATASVTEEGSQEGQQPVTTPSKKQELFADSAEKSTQKRKETSAVDLQAEDAVEVREKSNPGNFTNVADLSVGQKGSAKQTDDHTGAQVGSTTKEKSRQNLKQKLSKMSKVPSAQANTQGTEVERKDDEPTQKQPPATSLDPKKNLEQKRVKMGHFFKTSTAASSSANNVSEMQQEMGSGPEQQSKAGTAVSSSANNGSEMQQEMGSAPEQQSKAGTAVSSSANNGGEMQQEMGSGPEQQQQIVEHKSEFRENARVRMHGLTAVQYNGRTAVLQTFDADDGRWVVTLDNGRDTIRVREANMVVHVAVEETSPEARHQTSRQSVAVDGPPAKRQKVVASELGCQKYEDVGACLVACFADAQIEYKADGKTQTSHPNSYQRYAGYANANTIQEAVSLGATPEDIVYDFNSGLLKIITLRHAAPQAVQG